MGLPNVLKLAGSGVSEIVSLYDSTAQQTAAADAEKTLYTLPGGIFANDGDTLYYELSGTFGGAADTGLILKANDGTSDATLFTSGVIDPTNDVWVLRGRAIRTDASNLKNVATLTGATINLGTVTLPSLDLTQPIRLIAVQQGTDGLSAETVHLDFRAAP